MSNLKRFDDEERESKYGRVFAVSGPGKHLTILSNHNSCYLKVNKNKLIIPVNWKPYFDD